jgi:hypothetical protein
VVPDTRCKADLGIGSSAKWRRWQIAFSDIFPPAIEINGRNHRDADLWEIAKEKLIAASDPNVTQASAARARAGRGRREAPP